MSADDPNPTRTMGPAAAASWWFARLQRGALEPAEARAFESWLETGGAAEAFDKARRVWSLTGEAADAPQMRAWRMSALARARPPRRAIRALAAALALCAAVGLALWQGPFGGRDAPPDGLRVLGGADYATAVGERLSVTLPDGSLVTLNTDSALDVVYADRLRLVRLLKGQAYFEVAPDADSPFVVEAAGRRITALGTAFDVRLDSDRFQILLAEGRVGVSRSPYGFDARGEGRDIVLEPGQGLIAAFGAPEEVAAVDVEQQLRWRHGFVEFDGEPLVSVVAEMNRYAAAQLLVQDPRISDLRVSGVFRTGDQSQFVEVITRVLPVAAQRQDSGSTRLVWAPPDGPN